MCGSTSVACCPGATVNGSELIWVRFGPTGLTGRVGVVNDEDGGGEPEHPASTSSNGARQNTLLAAWERRDRVNILRIQYPELWQWADATGRIELLENLHHAENRADVQYGSQIPYEGNEAQEHR